MREITTAPSNLNLTETLLSLIHPVQGPWHSLHRDINVYMNGGCRTLNTCYYTWVFVFFVKADHHGSLDRLYANQGMVNLVKRTCVSPSGFSDHHMVVMVCTLPFNSCGSASWTFIVKL